VFAQAQADTTLHPEPRPQLRLVVALEIHALDGTELSPHPVSRVLERSSIPLRWLT
jgi:hypothetical protein